jgi:hypothetical protein
MRRRAGAGVTTVDVDRAAAAHVRSVEGAETGQVFLVL